MPEKRPCFTRLKSGAKQCNRRGPVFGAMRGVLVGIIAGLLLGASAGAQQWPTRPIRFILPFGAGGVADIPLQVLAAGGMGEAFQSQR